MRNMIILQSKQLIFSVFCLYSFLCFSDDQFKNYILTTNPIIGNQRLDTNIIGKIKVYSSGNKDDTTKLYEVYLIGVMENSEASMSMKVTAIALLGKLRTAKAIQCLVRNIDFKNNDNRTLPAHASIIDIGEESIPYLIEGIESEDSSNLTSRTKIYLMVQAIREIKKDKYKEFFDDAMKKYSIKVQDALRKCTINF